MVYYVGGRSKNIDGTFTYSLWELQKNVAEELQVRGRQIEEKEAELRNREALRDQEDNFAKIQRQAFEGMISTLHKEYNNMFKARTKNQIAAAILSPTDGELGEEHKFRLYDIIRKDQVKVIGKDTAKIKLLKSA